MRGLGLALAILAACPLGACKPSPGRSWGFAGLDCKRGYAGLKAEIKAKPGVRPASYEDGYLVSYQSDPELRLYIVTQPGHPAHPSVVVSRIMPTSEGMTFDVSGCAYGDKAATDQLIKEYQVYGRAVQGDYDNAMSPTQRLSPAAEWNRVPPPPAPK